MEFERLKKLKSDILLWEKKQQQERQLEISKVREVEEASLLLNEQEETTSVASSVKNSDLHTSPPHVTPIGMSRFVFVKCNKYLLQ